MSLEPSRNVNLWKKNLGHVPDEVWEQLEIETLVLADNGLTEIPARIGDLKQLRMLDLGHNALAHLPEELGDLTGLRDFLYLHDNRLASLPDSTLQNIGMMDARRLRDLALAYTKKDEAGAQLSDALATIARQNADIEMMKRQFAELAATQQEIKRGPGRPRKEESHDD